MHHGTHDLPATEWHNSVPQTPQFHIFGQLGTTPDPRQPKTTISKFHSRSRTVRYLYPTDDRHIMALDVNTSKTHRIRIVDFHPHFRTQDPKMTSAAAFKGYTPHRTPDELSISTAAPPTAGKPGNTPTQTSGPQPTTRSSKRSTQNVSYSGYLTTYSRVIQASFPLRWGTATSAT